MDTAGLSCQLYVAAYISACTAARTICYVLDRLEQTAWHLRQQLTARTVAATLVAAVLLVASVNLHQQADGHLAAISIAVPPPADCYTVMVSLTIVNLPSVTLEPASMDQHQLKESWDESWCIMASGKRTMAPGEAGSRAIRRLIKDKRTPSDLRKACREMQHAAKVCYDAIQEKFEAESEAYKAEMKVLVEKARLEQLAHPKGTQQPDIPGYRRSRSDATVTIGEVRLQHAQECVLLTATNSQIGIGIGNKNYENKMRQLADQMARSLFLSGSSIPTDMSQGMDVMMMYVTAPTTAMREGRYVVSSSIILKQKSNAWMSPKVQDAIRKGQSISFCLFDAHTSSPVTNSTTEQPANGHAFCVKLRVVLGKRWSFSSQQYEKVPIVHYNLVDTDLKDESERQQQLDRIISSTAFTSNILAAYGGDAPAAKHPPKYSTHTVHVMAPNSQIRKIQCSPGTTLSAVLHSHYGTDEHRDTVMTSLGPFSGATKMSHFGAITGSQDAAERPEGLLMLSTEEAERVRPVALEVPVIVKKTGQKDESHVVYLSQDEVESTAVDIANIVCGDDYWNISAKSDKATGSMHLQQPVKFTVPYLKEEMGGNVTIVVSIDEPPPVTPPPTTQLAYDKTTGKASGPADGPARGSHRGSGAGRDTNVWGGHRDSRDGRGNQDDGWGPNDHNEGPPAQQAAPVEQAPPEYFLHVMHMAVESASTPHVLPRHHVHETTATTNKHQTTSTTTFGMLMRYYGMSGARCNATAYNSGQIKHSMYDIPSSLPIGRLAPSGTVLVLWDNASQLKNMTTTLWCGESREQGPRAKVVIEYQLAACDETEPPMRNTIGTIKVGALMDGNFTRSNLQHIYRKVQEWADMHFSKNRHPTPALGSHVVDIAVFDTVDNVRCEFDQDRGTFWPPRPASEHLEHRSTNQLEVVINLNMQDTQTLLHQHLPNRPLKNLRPCSRSLKSLNVVISEMTEEEKSSMTAMIQEVATATAYAASSCYRVNENGITADRSQISSFAMLTRSDTACVSAVLANDSVSELLSRESSPTYLAGMIADWVSAEHHRANHNNNVNQTSLYDHAAVERARLRLASAPAEQPGAPLAENLSMLDLQRLNDDWQTAAVKEAVRKCKTERYYDAFFKRLKLLKFGEMECFQDIFHEAARLHIQQMTTTSNKQVTGAYRVLTSVLIGYQTADATGYKTWVTELVNSETADAKKMLYALLTHHELSPAYYMLGWQFVHTRETLQEAYGSTISCTGSHEQGGNCIVAHEHTTVTETNCASTGWTFLIEANEPVKVAVGVHVKRRAGVTHRTYMGDGGKPTAMQLDESGNKPEGISAEFAKLCLGERENPVSAKVREGFEETGSLIQPSRWRLSWLGTGTIGRAWQLFDFSTFLTANDKMTHKQQPFADCEEFHYNSKARKTG